MDNCLVTFERMRGRSHSDKRHTHELSRPSPMTLATYNALFLVRMTIGASQTGFTRAQLGPVMLILPGEDCQSKSDSRFSRCLDRQLWTIRMQEKFESGTLGETKWGQKRALETGCLDRAPSMFCNWKGGGGRGGVGQRKHQLSHMFIRNLCFPHHHQHRDYHHGHGYHLQDHGHISTRTKSKGRTSSHDAWAKRSLSLTIIISFSNPSNIHFASSYGKKRALEQACVGDAVRCTVISAQGHAIETLPSTCEGRVLYQLLRACMLLRLGANWFYSRIDQSIGCHTSSCLLYCLLKSEIRRRTEEHMNRDHWRGYRGGGGGRAANGVVERQGGWTQWATI